MNWTPEHLRETRPCELGLGARGAPAAFAVDHDWTLVGFFDDLRHARRQLADGNVVGIGDVALGEFGRRADVEEKRGDPGFSRALGLVLSHERCLGPDVAGAQQRDDQPSDEQAEADVGAASER